MDDEDFWLGWWKFAQSAERAAWLVAVGGAAAWFCPVWSGDWSPGRIHGWLEAMGAMAIIVWLLVLSNALRRAGHGIHAALVIALGFPMLRVATRAMSEGPGLASTSIGATIEFLYGDRLTALLFSGLVALAIIESIGRGFGWRGFNGLGPAQRPEAR